MSARLLAAVLIALTLSACGSPLPNRDPVGERFPKVQGASLEGESITLPDALAGKPAVLLVGYVQNTQFDLDRWILGLLQAGTPVQLLEVPTIDGLVPGMIANTINEGMRGGIPEEDWGSVVTVYDDAEAIVNFTGNTRPQNGRIFLLDASGTVRWFHDRGYSASVLLKLDELARSL
ncbi:MAG: hypothetical protein DHS20C15_13860 [Planctomycetota bacterium]|nr:MAG: hypothetical protein DHS20C15_13860 [Planctomycetota bacterium]